MSQYHRNTGVNRSHEFVDKVRGFSKTGTFAVVSLGILLLMALAAIFAPFISPYPPLETRAGTPFLPPNLNHPMGTDDLGRDILSGVLYGIRTSFLVGFLAGGISTFLGVLVGAVSGYYGGKIDEFSMRATEIFLTIPALIFAIVLVAFFGNTISNIIIIIGLLGWTSTARQTRAQFLSIKKREFVEASKAMGASDREIIFSDILPNASFVITVSATIDISLAVLIEAAIAFLGAGDPGIASLGRMVSNAHSFILQAWWMAAFPGLALFLIILSLNVLGDSLNEYWSPKSEIA